jgi:hypothetical protein
MNLDFIFFVLVCFLFNTAIGLFVLQMKIYFFSFICS